MASQSEWAAAAWQHYQRGEAPQAEQACWRMLSLEPLNAEAVYLLGLLALDAGQPARALLHFHHATLLRPAQAGYHHALGAAYQALGRPIEAKTSFQEAIRLAPGLAAAHQALGGALLDEGDVEAATACFRQALAFQPNYEKAHLNLGRALHARGDLEGAARCYREAVRLKPDYAIAHNNLGAVYQSQNRPAEAESHFREALRLQPTYPEAHFNLGITLQARGDPAAGAASLAEAIRLRPDYPRAHQQLGRALASLGRGDAAYASYQEALRLKPDLAEAYLDLGSLFLEQCMREKARAAFEKALAARPDFPEARACLANVRAWLCDWTNREAELDQLWQETERALAEGRPLAVTPFQALTSGWSGERQLAVARGHAEHVLREVRGLRETLPFTPPAPPGPGRLRLGYLSADFHAHATLHLMQGLFGLHDRQRFEVFAYSLGPDDRSPYRQRVAQDCEHFVDVHGASVADVARRINADGIHLLIDLKGYTGGGRPGVLALRPAPIQVNYLGYPGTMGAGFIDYLISDRVITPPEAAGLYTERLVLLPHSYQVNDHQQPIAPTPVSRTAAGLPERAFVFCCFNNSYKMEPMIFGTWMRILSQVPDSVLWLLSCGETSERNLRREAAACGVPADRLRFTPHLPKPEHLARLRLAHLFLDTYFVNAHTTASDALWAGVPVLTCPGSTFVSRVAASLLTAVGMPELIAADLSQYERLAVDLARRPDDLARLRRKLAGQRTTQPLFDTPRFVRNLERAYQTMWEAHLAGERPRVIVVTEPPEKEAGK
ncbi:MAG: tetratricopeptide repeat protein [Planctomycetes bacterium]|nr:tetratricopeptide repeat protein [Planctomycetota bacterium]